MGDEADALIDAMLQWQHEFPNAFEGNEGPTKGHPICKLCGVTCRWKKFGDQWRLVHAKTKLPHVCRSHKRLFANTKRVGKSI